MLVLKSHVRLSGLSPQIMLAVIAAHSFWESQGVDLVITSANDGGHSHTSLHYAGAAIDLRTKNLPEDDEGKRLLARKLSDSLGQDFDVIFEGAGTSNEHIHIEYQPKRRE